jgi:hypothetical protein
VGGPLEPGLEAKANFKYNTKEITTNVQIFTRKAASKKANVPYVN